jgi:hypothetical protein
MSKTFPKIDKNFNASFSSIFVLSLIVFLGVSRGWEFKITTKSVNKKAVSKAFTKNPKLFLSRFVFVTILGVSRREEVENTINFLRKLTLVLFWPLTHPPMEPPILFGGPFWDDLLRKRPGPRAPCQGQGHPPQPQQVHGPSMMGAATQPTRSQSA